MLSSDDGQDNELNAWNTGVTFGRVVEAVISISGRHKWHEGNKEHCNAL
jgi:hypothetical protein